MKNNYLILFLLIGILMSTTIGCVEEIDADIAELQDQIDELKLTLESNNAIKELLIEEGQLLLVFEDGTNISTVLPENPIPYIGDNGNWFVGDTDLGSPAVAEVPTIGGNGNWIIDGEDSGISAEATNGEDGEDGVDGLAGDGVTLVTYDQTTGILEITLDSGTVYSFELYLEDSIKGVKLEDLNGEYLLSTIYNGDIPFATFTYDANNRLTDISYFTTILNEPVEYLRIHKDLDTDGNITAQTVIEYATKAVAIAEEEDPLVSGLNGIVYSDLNAAFDLLFPSGIAGYSGAGDDFFSEIIVTDQRSTFFDDTYVYIFDATESEVTVYLRSIDTNADFGYSQLASMDYIWTPEYDSEYSEWGNLPFAHGTVLSSVEYLGATGGFSYTTPQEYVYYYPLASSATLYTGETDVVTAEYVDDYIGTLDDNVEVIGSPNGEYRVLFNSYEMYDAGEEISSIGIHYTYDGEDFTIAESEENENLIHIVVADDLITDIYVRDFEDEDTCDNCRVKAIDLDTMVHVLQFSYNADNQLEYVSLPDDAVTDAIRMAYDTQGNPIEFEVNPFKFKDISDGEDLALLGLSFAYDEYDSELGAVVEKYAYPDEYITMVSVDYNYELKNFMNHTFTAMNPLLTMFDNGNAIEKIGWAGHGSALLSEYTEFNEGGYPTEIKTYIQVSVDDIVSGLDDNDLQLDFGVPFNGSIAVTYRLEYIEKQ